MESKDSKSIWRKQSKLYLLNSREEESNQENEYVVVVVKELE